MAAQLKISDGTTTISLIDIGPGIHLNDWTPAIAQYKGGGVFRSNPQSSGRRLVQKQFDNVIEAFDLKVNNLKRNALIFQMQEVLRLLEKATDYWTSDWQNEVVYLIAQAECEDNARYAEVVNYSIPQLDNPYSAPFLSNVGAVFDGITLGIERKHWKENIPSTGTAVEISSTQDYDGRTLGRTATDDFEVFVANKHNVANLSDIYIDDGGVFGSNLMDTSLPYSLLPATPAVNDAVYFGIDTSLSDSGPFASLVFDIGTALSGTMNMTWEYWNGAWTAFAQSVGKEIWDQTSTSESGGASPWTNTGVNVVQWLVPSDWATTSVNSITGYWVRARVSSFTSIMDVPTQQNRNIYSVVVPYINIDSAQVLGDIPSLARTIIANPIGDLNSVGEGILNPNIWIERVICGLRSMSRGSSFTAYLDCSGLQPPDDAYSVNATGGVTFAADLSTPSAFRAVYNPGTIQEIYKNAKVRITLATQTDWIGRYHAFVRARQVGGDTGDIKMRLVVAARIVTGKQP